MRLEADDTLPVAFELCDETKSCERPQSASAIYTIKSDMILRTLYSGRTLEPRLPVPHKYSA